jgi:hypothetical protein
MQGFLAPRSRNGKGLILHLTQFEIALAAPIQL